jgi:hypothetical protein
MAGESANGKTYYHDLHGFGGSRKIKCTTLPNLVLQIGDSACSQRAPTLLLEPPNQDPMFYYGVLGIETLTSTRQTVLDFGAMRLSMDCLPQ